MPPFRGHRLSGLGGRRGDPALEGYRRDLAERAMDGVDPAADGVDRVGSGRELMSLVEIGFQGGPKALRLGVVPAHPGSPDRGPDVEFFGGVGELGAGVLTGFNWWMQHRRVGIKVAAR